MKPDVLDLREEGCPMALLLAKRASKVMTQGELLIHIRDLSSMKDMVRYFDSHGFSVQVEDSEQDYILTINKMSTRSDV